MSAALVVSLSAAALAWLLAFLLWFIIWTPIIALLEYGTHRWIMHRANRLLDPNLAHLQDHGKHHKGANGHYFVDMPLKDCLVLTSPAFLLLTLWGLLVGPFSAVVIPAAALTAWCCVYTYLWTRIHRAIHGVETNWFQRCGGVFRFFRSHHLQHHAHAKMNYGTVFPWSDYLFFTWRMRPHRRRPLR